MTLQNLDSNWVYVVSLGPGTPNGWRISWIDIVGKNSMYFHPVGGHWPKEPPNYIAFRYRGKLQWIHHIESAEVFTDPHSKFPGIPDRKWEPHFLYCLGPKLAPSHDVPMGKLYPNGRNRCWTFNFAHPLAWLIVALIVLIPAGIAIVATKMAGK